jgi:hypothetical protein
MSRTVRRIWFNDYTHYHRRIPFGHERAYEHARQDLKEYGIIIPKYDKPNTYYDPHICAVHETPSFIYSCNEKEKAQWARKRRCR